MKRRILSLLLTLSGIGVSLAASQPASARELMITGPRGRQAQIQKQINQSRYNRQKLTTVTGPRGEQATTQRQLTRDGRTLNYDRVRLFPRGRSTTATGSVTGTGQGNYEGSITVTGPRDNPQTYQIEGNYRN